jgi:hypothetical protein
MYRLPLMIRIQSQQIVCIRQKLIFMLALQEGTALIMALLVGLVASGSFLVAFFILSILFP